MWLPSVAGKCKHGGGNRFLGGWYDVSTMPTITNINLSHFTLTSFPLLLPTLLQHKQPQHHHSNSCQHATHPPTSMSKVEVAICPRYNLKWCVGNASWRGVLPISNRNDLQAKGNKMVPVGEWGVQFAWGHMHPPLERMPCHAT